MPRHIKLEECFWVRSPNSEHNVFQPTIKALQARGAKNYSLRMKSDPESLPKLKEILWKTDAHVILHGLLPRELHALRPILESRKNFSIVAIDWWTNSWWYTRHAEYLFFNLYSGIAVRNLGAKLVPHDWNPAIFSMPEMWISFHIAASLLRPVCRLVSPLREVIRRHQQALDDRDPKRFLYFPISINTTDLPLRSEGPDEYDFANIGATLGIWLMRDAHAPTRYDFANFYYDRERLIDSILEFDQPAYRVFDRRAHGRIPWEQYCRVVHRSRYCISTGGLHEASIPKFLEYVCMGTPVLGRPLPYEYPLLRNCIFTVDAMRSSPAQLKAKLEEALAVQPKLRENCLAVRDKIIQLYNPDRIIDLLQEQIDGKPIPSDYVQPPS
jgi:hypothetical protein